MNTFTSLILAETKERAQWVVDSFPIIRIVLASLIAVAALILIVAVLSQQSTTSGAGAITGETNTYYNRNKGQSLQGKIKKLTIVDAIVLVGLCIIYLIITSIYSGV